MNSYYPKELYCPITHELYDVPVMAEDGITYEKEAITRWLQTSNRSPITNTVISIAGLKINYTVKSMIESATKGSSVTIDTSNLLASSSIGTTNLKVTKHNFNDNGYLHVKVESPEEGSSVETVFICLIDISGSTGCDASIEESKGESHGFSRLDLIKHSIKTVINCVDGYFAAITFSDVAKILQEPIKMCSTNKSIVCDKIDALNPTNTTNIWDALRLGIEVANNPEFENKNISILLFTDGVPNINPPRGIINSLERLLERDHLKASINTFGFGYDLDSSLLRNIANNGLGTYSFIPDATMVGTIFVNFVANTLLTYTNNITIEIITGVPGSEQVIKNIPISSIQYGQDKDFIIKVPDDNIRVKLGSHVIQFSNISEFGIVTEEFAYHYCRQEVIDLIGNLLGINNVPTHDSIARSITLVNNKYEELSRTLGGSDKIGKLLNDVVSDTDGEGQILKSVSRHDWFVKWGKHYLLSIQRAHELQICNNFKDPGVQLYGGKVFSDLRDKIEEVFCNTPPPEPSVRAVRQTVYSGNAGSVPRNVAPTNMSSYMNSGGGCFDGNSMVLMSDNTLKQVKDLRKDDIVIGGHTIKCVVKTSVNDNLEMVNINGMLITPWHPIHHETRKHKHEWVFPINILSSINVEIDYIYNIVLESGHVMVINDIKVITLGHDFKDNSVVQHDYYGSDKVINDLKKMDGWDNGMIVIDKLLVERGPDGHVTSMENSL